MKTVAINCPKCSQVITADAEIDADAEIACPRCQTVFFIDDGELIEEETALEQQTRRLESAASVFRVLCLIAGCVFVLSLNGAIFFALQGTKSWIPLVWIASSAFGATVLLWIITQLFTIRAQLCRLETGIKASR